MGRAIPVFLTMLAFAGCSGPERGGTRDAGTTTDDAGNTTSVGDTGGGRDATATPDGGSQDVSTPDDTSSPDGSAPIDTGAPTTISERHPGDEGIAADPAVLFHDDFEAGWGRWDAPQSDTNYLTMQTDPTVAHAGSGYLQSTVTFADLDADQYISSQSRVGFDRVEEVYWRFYARMPNVAPNPHHWVRVSAGNATWESSGLANTVPPGDEGFWFDFDISNDDVFNFYVYWHEMRSGRCNDGSATPGCDGDQGTTYYYGNVFRPPDQMPYPRDQWFCIEMRAKANTVGDYDGELTFWIDDRLVGDYRKGYPEGTWLRSTFHTNGCDFSACADPAPFEGFNFRTSSDVGFKAVILDAYYQRDTAAQKRQALEDRGLTVSDQQTIYYDDVVVATERIGCRVAR